MKAINEYVSKYVNNDCGWTEKGRIHLARNELKEALKATKKSISINAYNTHAWNNLGVIENKLKNYSESIKAFKQAIKYDPYNVGAMSNILEPLGKLNLFTEAIMYVSQAITLNPRKHNVKYNAQGLMMLLFENKQFDLAEKLLLNWIKLCPDEIDAHHNLGLVYLEKSQTDKAIECFEVVFKLNNKDEFAIKQLAKLFFDKKSARQCIKYCDLLIRNSIDIDMGVTLTSRVVNFINGYQSALNYIRGYIKQYPDRISFYFAESEIHEYREQHSRAIASLKRVRNLLVRSRQSGAIPFIKDIDKRIIKLKNYTNDAVRPDPISRKKRKIKQGRIINVNENYQKFLDLSKPVREEDEVDHHSHVGMVVDEVQKEFDKQQISVGSTLNEAQKNIEIELIVYSGVCLNKVRNYSHLHDSIWNGFKHATENRILEIDKEHPPLHGARKIKGGVVLEHYVSKYYSIFDSIEEIITRSLQKDSKININPIADYFIERLENEEVGDNIIIGNIILQISDYSDRHIMPKINEF